MKAKIFCFLVLSCVLVQPLWADPVFDFESVSPGFYSGSVTVTNSGLTLTVTPEGYPSGWLYVNPAVSPVNPFGQGVIGSVTNPLNQDQFAPMRFAFSQPISSMTFAFGDMGGDADSPWFIRAYDLSDNLVASNTGNYDSGVATGLTSTLNIGGSGASYFILSSTPASNQHSMYWEVQSATVASTVVPEPSTLILLNGGLVLVALFRKSLG